MGRSKVGIRTSRYIGWESEGEENKGVKNEC
jgi:hypothetical protein